MKLAGASLRSAPLFAWRNILLPHAIWDFSGIPISRVCSAMSRVNFWLSECVLPCPVSISGRQSVFCRVPVHFRPAEYVPPCPGSISGRHVPAQFSVSRVCSAILSCPGRFPVSRVCSATSWVDFWSSECVPPPPCSKSISGRQSVFRHVPGSFQVVRVCSAASLVNF